ncbi:MAG: hypothetical protein Q7J34_04025 [Bacteroidales bacterium]|nr:hypothetical protein [Bacteroidales bacterium]
MKKILSFTIVYLAFSLYAWSQWTSDVMNNTTFCNNPGQKFSTVVTPGLNGQVFIAWIEANPTITVKMQLINADGTLCWDPQGLTISSSLENEYHAPLDIISDENGNAFIVWYDLKDGMNELYASKISSNGEFLWGTEGVTIYQTDIDTSSLTNTSISLSQIGNLFIGTEMISFTDGKNKIMLQKIGSDGAISWVTPVMINDASFSCGKPKLISSGADGSMVSFTKSSGGLFGSVVTIWVQKFDESGNALFGEGKVIYNLGFMTLWQNYDALSGGEDDMLIAWHSFVGSSSRPDSYLQHISSEGVISWQENGLLLSTESNIFNDFPRIAGKNQDGETVVFWNHRIDLLPCGTEIYGQKFSSTGERLWTDFGKKFISNAATSFTGFTIDNAFISDNLSFLIYDSLNVDNVSMNLNQIIAVGIDSYGNFLWEEPSSALSLSNTSKSYIVRVCL